MIPDLNLLFEEMCKMISNDCGILSKIIVTFSSIIFAYFFMKSNYYLKCIFFVRLFQILFSELIKMSSKDKKSRLILIKPGWSMRIFRSGQLMSRMGPQIIDVKSVTRQVDYQIWELVPLKFMSKVPLMKLLQRKFKIFLGAQRHQQVLIHQDHIVTSLSIKVN